MNNILVVNPGSTAIKYIVFSSKGEQLEKLEFDFSKTDIKKNKEFLENLKNISKIGLRVVHGGDLDSPILIDKKVLGQIKEFEIFAPIHNKIALNEIKKLRQIFGNTKIYAVFDTDFHRTIPKENYTIPINQEIAKKYKIRKYGFHGTAVLSALNQVQDIFKKKKKKFPQNIIFAHLGGGSSVTAVKNKKSFANSMGVTPLSGLMMKTRAGDVDPDLNKILIKKMKKSITYISDLLSNKSGFLGLTGSLDTRKIIEKVETDKKGKYKKEKLAFDLYLNSIVEKIYAYAGLMGNVDIIVFSGGIGEGNEFLRNQILKKMKLLGITKKDIFAIKINEEKEIAKQIKNL